MRSLSSTRPGLLGRVRGLAAVVALSAVALRNPRSRFKPTLPARQEPLGQRGR